MDVLSPEHLVQVAAAARQALASAKARDWSSKATNLDWTCRRTLDHVSDALALYSVLVATRANGRVELPRNGDPSASVDNLLAVMDDHAHVLAELTRGMRPEERAYHPAGMADASGFVAMGCDEILIHTADIAGALDISFEPSEALAKAVLDRLFPWAGADNPWPLLLWCNGRLALPERPQLGPDWYWHSAPLGEWNGGVNKRKSPPAWR